MRGVAGATRLERVALTDKSRTPRLLKERGERKLAVVIIFIGKHLGLPQRKQPLIAKVRRQVLRELLFCFLGGIRVI